MGAGEKEKESVNAAEQKNIEALKGLYNMHTVTHMHNVVPLRKCMCAMLSNFWN